MKRFAPDFHRIANFFHSVRFRLSLWFALILAVILVLFSAFVYYRESQAIHDEAVSRLNERLNELTLSFRRAVRMPDENDPFRMPNFIATTSTNLQPGEVLVLVGPDGKLTNTWGPIQDQTSQSLVDQMPSHSPGQGYYVDLPITDKSDEEKYLFTFIPLGYENHALAYVLLGQPIDPNSQLPRLIVTLLLGGLLFLLVALVGGYLLADRALWPVKAITRTAQEISETDLSQRLNINTRDELGELAGTFDRMLDRLQAAFNRQRQFTADASHELRTPLTIIGLETDRALATGRSNDDYRRALQVIHSENDFMTHLVGELLTLARMDAGQLKMRYEPVDLSDVALEVAERYSRLANQRSIQLQTGDLPELPVQGDRQYLTQMISNLVENAIKYSPEGPGQWVRVETGCVEKTAWVRVSDNGIGIAADHLPRIFDRFYRVDQARSHNTQADDSAGEPEEIAGSGLGLAIVQWIARMHNGQVTVQSQPGQGSTFEVTLPLGK